MARKSLTPEEAAACREEHRRLQRLEQRPVEELDRTELNDLECHWHPGVAARAADEIVRRQHARGGA